MGKLKALIVDDSALYRKIVAKAVEDTDLAVVESTASNGEIALERLENNKYDVILLDVNMPDMDGIDVLKRIKQKGIHTPVIMVSSIGGKNVAITIKALELGAMDFIVKPLEEDYEKNLVILKNHLKVIFAQIRINNLNTKTSTPQPIRQVENSRKKTYISGVDLLLIASSTGGPVALSTVFEKFNGIINKPMLIIQHMPPNFTQVMAESLDKKSEINVIEGKDGDLIKSGRAIVAPGGMHMQVFKDDNSIKHIKLLNGDYTNGVRPSADVLFKSVAQEYKGMRILAVVLTGMGSDGLEGVRELKKRCNCYCVTQDEKSCVVYGMPRSIVEAGLSDEVLDIGDIASRIRTIVEHGS